MKISVIITTYNRCEFVKRALRSVVDQSSKPYEILVVDDGSDKLVSKKEFSDARYFYKQNCGISSARNFGIKHSTGDWIAFLDDDDEWDREKLASHLSFHAQNPNYQISYTNEKWIRDQKEINIPKKYQKHRGNIYEKCLSHCIIAPSSVFIKKSLFDKVGFFDEDLEVCEDYDMWLRISSICPIGLIDEPLTIKHAGHDDQLSFKYWGMDRFRVKSLLKILPSIKNDVQKELTKKMLLQKLDLLIKGAKKHERFKIVKEYEKTLDLVKAL